MQQLIKIQIQGAVQGVGFRPFVYRLATNLKLTGFVCNAATGVFIEAEGPQHLLEIFLLRLQTEKPSIAAIYSLEYCVQDAVGYSNFEIRQSRPNGHKTATILPDLAVCYDCLNEMFNPANRRYHYPFINCTHCGPRFSIIEAIPYDRPHTSMKQFKMCPDCEREYLDPNNRRFHAQPNACPVCGPHIELWNPKGEVLATHEKALEQAVALILEGKILALKGMGGFQLLVDAASEAAVTDLRKRKHRNEKPLALMYPSVQKVKEDCVVSVLEERLLCSPAAPVVLLERKKKQIPTIAESVAPGNPFLGVMLPYTPLHHLMLHELNLPIVATSGNLSNEPICIDEYDALDRLQAIADFFLVHNRPVVRQVDDSVVRIVAGREQVLRRARGYAPLPIALKKTLPTLLAVGSHLKNTVAVSSGNEIFVSQHIGDLETEPAYTAFKNVIDDFKALYEIRPSQTVCDLHPDYLSTKYAKAVTNKVVAVQHHYAHVLACMADNELEGPVLGISWDGTGYGTDGTIWGSEFLRTTGKSFERVGHFRSFRLPGGEAAVKQPRRTALGVLYEILGEKVFENSEWPPLKSFSAKDLLVLKQMLKNQINTPLTCSAGRLFDAVTSLIGLRQQVSFEGQAAMELEFAVDKEIKEGYAFAIEKATPFILNWQPVMEAILADVLANTPAGIIAAKFHNALVEIIVTMAQKVGEPKVVLTGGCFQNKFLTERTIKRLLQEGFQPYWHQRIPPNDGGIAVGQILAAAQLHPQLEGKREKEKWIQPV